MIPVFFFSLDTYVISRIHFKMENDMKITNTISLEDWMFECASCSMKFKTQKDFKQHFEYVQCNKSKTSPTCGKIIVSKECINFGPGMSNK